MRFDRTVKRQNANFDKEVATKEQCLRYIAEIDQNLEYVSDDSSKYEEVKKFVQTFEPTEYKEYKLTEEAQQSLQAKLNHLYELAESLK